MSTAFDIYTKKKVKHHFLLWRKLTKISHFQSPDHAEIFRVACGRFILMQRKLLKFGGFRFWATEDTKYHSWIFSISLNVSLPLVFCTAQKTILANKHNAKWKKEACPMNNWKRFWKTVAHLSCALPYVICILHWSLWKPKFFDNFWYRPYLNNSQKSKSTIFAFQQNTNKLQNVYKKKENDTKTCYLKSIPPATKVDPQIE